MSNRVSQTWFDLVPVAGLESVQAGHWVATNEDPQFEAALPSHLRGQWVRFTADVALDGRWISRPVIYIDCGSGYSEASALMLALPLEGELVELIFYLPNDAVRLRFDPFAQRGQFRLGSVRLQRLGRARAALEMCVRVARRRGWNAVLWRAARAVVSGSDGNSLRQFFQWLRAVYRNPDAEPMPDLPQVQGATIQARGEANLASAAVRQPQRIQVHRRNALGDVLLITPVVRALRRKYPRARITVTTLYPDLLEHNPDIDELLRADAPLRGFDLTFDLQYELFPELHIVDAYAKIAQVDAEDRTPTVYLVQDDLGAADALLREAGVYPGRPLVAFHMESGWRVRDWSIERFRQVAEALRARDVQVVVLGERPTVPVNFAVDLRGRTSVRSLAAVIFKCDALLSIDSGLMHLAAALRRPFVGLFGCTDPEKRVPDWALPSTIYAKIVCHGCHHRQRPVPATTAPVCPFETVRCMEEIEVDPVLARLTALLEAASNPLVSIVIPHYRHYDVLQRCLASVFRVGASAAFEVIVVDDSGTGEESGQIAAWAPRVRLVCNPKNFGFARACNAGVEVARGEFVVLLNNDTTVTSGWLDRMLALYRSDPRVGIVGPKLLYPGSEAIQHCGTVINEHGVAEHLYRLLPGHLAGANRVRRYRALTGACMLVRRQDLLDIGGLDPEYRNGGEDTDLCFSFLERGRTLLYCPDSVVYHHEGYSRGTRNLEDPDDRFNRNRLRERWRKYLVPDISDYCLLAEIESAEGRTWRALDEVPEEIRARYDTPQNRAVGRYPFRCEIGSGMNPQPGYLHVDVMRDAPSLDILHDVSRPLPFHDSTVGEMLANHVVEHVSWRDLPKLVADLQRVMVPGGRVYIRTPNLRFIAERFLAGQLTPEHPNDERAMRELYGDLTPGLWANIKLFSGQDYPSNYHYNCMDPGDLQALFRRCGFRSVRLETFGRQFSPGEIQLIAEK